MTWDSVPWFVGGGAQHSPEVARLLAYAATSGAEGIIAAGDLKVVPLAVAGSSIRVLVGACLILNRNSSGAQQTYVGRNPTEDVVAVAATGSGAGRNDLVIAQIKDPFLPGEPWADPADVTVGPYIFTETVPNVPLSATASNEAAAAYLRTKGISGIPLAALVIPASTATITGNEIKDIRKIARPRRERTVMIQNPGARTPTPVAGQPRAQFTNLDNGIYCPPWATRIKLIATASALDFRDGSMTGRMRAEYGFTLAGSPYIYTEDSGLMEDNAPSRQTIVMAGDLAIPANFRGTTQNVRLSALGVTGPGRAYSDQWSTLIVDAEFVEAAE